MSQCHFHITTHRPLETRPRLRPYRALYSSRRHLAVHTCDTRQPVLVGVADMQCDYHDFLGGMGVSVAGAETHQLREQDTRAITSCR